MFSEADFDANHYHFITSILSRKSASRSPPSSMEDMNIFPGKAKVDLCICKNGDGRVDGFFYHPGKSTLPKSAVELIVKD